MKRFVAGLALCCTPIIAQAQWFKQPNGAFAYGFEYTTNAFFTCNSAPRESTCVTDGNSVTIGNGTASVTIGFLSHSGSAVATNVRTAGLALGSFTTSYNGFGPFVWPMPTNVSPLFGMQISMVETTPFASSGRLSRHFRVVSPNQAVGNCCDGDWTHLVLGLSPQPPGLFYSTIVVDQVSRMTFNANDDDPVDVTASIGLVPEPSTYALLLFGVAVIGVAKWKQRRTRIR